MAEESPGSNRLTMAKRNLMRQFPGLNKLSFKVQKGSGPGFAEFFPADESMNPNPGTPTIEVRRSDVPDKELQSIILGDVLHLAGLPEERGGLSKFRGLKEKFIEQMHPRQIEVARQMFDETKKRNPSDPRNFQEFLDQVAADAFIRDYFFQKSESIPGGKPFVSGVGPVMGGFFEDQVPILERMRLLLERGEKANDG